MSESQHQLLTRLSGDFYAISQYMARVATDLSALDRVLAGAVLAPRHGYWAAPGHPQYPAQPSAPQPAASEPEPAQSYPAQSYPAQPEPAQPQPVSQPQPIAEPQPAVAPEPAAERNEGWNEGWIGKLLAVAGVGVTLTGVVLLLVLAAQAGILRPEFRVAGGVALAAGLVAVAIRLKSRPGGLVGAVALAATGIAAGYMDIIAVTTIYKWFPAPVGLIVAALIGGGGLTLARLWDSQHLGVLVFVPLTLLAPVVVGDVSLLLVAFMLALAAATLPVQLGRDWIWLHCARIASCTLPLLVALVGVAFDDARDAGLVAACVIAAGLAVVVALLLLPVTRNRILLALLTAAGVAPALCTRLAADRYVYAAVAAGVGVTFLVLVLRGNKLGVDATVRPIWTALSAVSAVIAVLAVCKGDVVAPVLLAMAVVVAAAARRTAAWVALGLAVLGGMFSLAYAPPVALVTPAVRLSSTTAEVTTLVTSLLLIAFAVVSVWAMRPGRGGWTAAAVVIVYAVTVFTVTVGEMIDGTRGFLAGHMAATICWIAMAAALFGYAARVHRQQRSLPIGGGLALVAAAMAKLFLFDLGTLDGMFRVVVFMVVGLVLLGMGAGYARVLERQDSA